MMLLVDIFDHDKAGGSVFVRDPCCGYFELKSYFHTRRSRLVALIDKQNISHGPIPSLNRELAKVFAQYKRTHFKAYKMNCRSPRVRNFACNICVQFFLC